MQRDGWSIKEMTGAGKGKNRLALKFKVETKV